MNQRNTGQDVSLARFRTRSTFSFPATLGITVLLAFLSGCPMSSPGLTTGGAQDIAAARQVIESGDIPDPGWITVEGFLSEHSIPIEEPQDAGLLYFTASAAWNADFDVFTPLATVVIGFGTTVDEDAFERGPLNLCLVIDSSASMLDPISERSGISKLEAVKIAIDRLLAQLDGQDRVSVVSFSTVSGVLLNPVPGDDIASIKSSYDTLETEGGTDLARGLRRGYRLLRANQSEGRSDRLLVFTDAQLNRRAERRTEWFIDVMEEYADDGIGATLFGIGTDFGHEIAYDISQVRGGNYYFLSDYDRIVAVFDDEFEFLVTPIAYDVELHVSVPFEFDVAEMHGIPSDAQSLPHELELDIPTLFLSSQQGGGSILIRVRPGALVDFSVENTVADVALSYTTNDGQRITQPTVSATIPLGLDPESASSYFENDGAKRAVLLLNTALTIQSACRDAEYWYGRSGWDYYPADYDRAVERLTEFLPYFDGLAAGMEDRVSDTSRTLSQERALVEGLLATVTQRAERER